MATKGKGRKPDFQVSALSKASEHRGNVGAAWINEDGTISIKLNSFVVLSAAQDLVITLFVNDGKKPWEKEEPKQPPDDPPAF